MFWRPTSSSLSLLLGLLGTSLSRSLGHEGMRWNHVWWTRWIQQLHWVACGGMDMTYGIWNDMWSMQIMRTNKGIFLLRVWTTYTSFFMDTTLASTYSDIYWTFNIRCWVKQIIFTQLKHINIIKKKYSFFNF